MVVWSKKKSPRRSRSRAGDALYKWAEALGVTWGYAHLAAAWGGRCFVTRHVVGWGDKGILLDTGIAEATLLHNRGRTNDCRVAWGGAPEVWVIQKLTQPDDMHPLPRFECSEPVVGLLEQVREEERD